MRNFSAISNIPAYSDHTTPHNPAILLTHYMDNTYVGFCNIPQHVLGVARQFLVHLQQALYQVPFKWEPEGQFLSWGECCVSCTPTLSLTLKGFRPGFFDPSVWDRWLDRWSPSCALVLQSMVPALVLKSIMFALSRANQSLNVEGVVTRFGYKGYQWSWWYMPLKCRLFQPTLTPQSNQMPRIATLTPPPASRLDAASHQRLAACSR